MESRRQLIATLLLASTTAAQPLQLPAAPAQAQAIAEAQLRTHQITLQHNPDSPWPPEAVIQLAEGLQHLPANFRTPPGGPLQLTWSQTLSPLGMGDGSQARPDWSNQNARFHLYAYQPATDRRASYRLERLTPAEQEALWRRRALVHAVVARWDAHHRWSDQHTWRRLNGWLRPFERLLTFSEQALNRAEWAYSRERGRGSASLDLLTFAEEALVPVESLRPGALEEADQVRCQEFSKSRVLAELGLLPAARPPCQRFDAWANPATLEGIELLFVAASGRAPESLFGHILMRISRAEKNRVSGPGLLPAVQLVALTGGDLPGPAYVARGLTGGYPMVLMTVPMLDVTRQMLEYEQRTMRRFRLRLTASESARLLERIWELERRGRLEYRFLHDNCAFAAAFVLQGALEEGRKVRLPSGITPLLPAATLDAVAKVPSLLGGPLLTPIPGAMASTRDLARHAQAQRSREAARLRVHSPRMHDLHRQAESPDGATRLAAYRQLAALAPEVAPSSSAQQDLFGYLAHSVDLERYTFDAAEAQAIKARLAALLGTPQVVSGEAEAAQRARQFEREADLEGAMALLDRPQRAQAFLEGLPKRVFTLDEKRKLDEADAAERRLEELLGLQARVVGEVGSGVDAVRWLAEDRARAAQEGSRLFPLSQRASGYGRFSGRLGITGEGSRAGPLLTLRSAAFSEELGDHRLHGLDPATELTTLGGEADVVWDATLPRVRRSEFLAVQYRNVRREPAPLRTDVLGSLGWGFRGGWSYDSRLDFSQRAFLSGEALAVLDSGPDLGRVTALGLGPSVALGLEGWQPELIGGPRVSFFHRRHLGGSFANALKMSAEYSPSFLLFSQGWQSSLRGSVQVEFVARFGSWPLLVSAFAGVEWFEKGDRQLFASPSPSAGSLASLKSSLSPFCYSISIGFEPLSL